MRLELPKIEVRYENLSVEADVYVGSRALPSLWNTTLNILEVLTDSNLNSRILHYIPYKYIPRRVRQDTHVKRIQ